jgi:hypothetical protein
MPTLSGIARFRATIRWRTTTCIVRRLDFPKLAEAAAVVRACTYVTTLAAIHPTCCFCDEPMEKIELWQYGLAAEPVGKQGDRCCVACHDSKVRPVLDVDRWI